MNLNLTDGALKLNFDDEDIQWVDSFDTQIMSEQKELDHIEPQTFVQNQKGIFKRIKKNRANEEMERFNKKKNEIILKKTTKNYEERRRIFFMRKSLEKFFRFFMGLQGGMHLILILILSFQIKESFLSIANYVVRIDQIELILFYLSFSLSVFQHYSCNKEFEENKLLEKNIDLKLFKSHQFRMKFIIVLLSVFYVLYLIKHFLVVEFSELVSEVNFEALTQKNSKVYLALQIISSVIIIVVWFFLICIKSSFNQQRNFQIMKFYLLIFFIFAINADKNIEKCFFEVLNKSDPYYKLGQDYTNLYQAILDFHQLPEHIQNEMVQCGLQIKESLVQCEKHYGMQNCEQCGIAFVKRCPDNFIRISCLICARKCPPGTMPDSLGALCAKPIVKKKQIFSNELDCLKRGNTECENYGTYATSKCPQYYSNLGNFMCSYKCPEGFQENDQYCIPDQVRTALTFLGSLV